MKIYQIELAEDVFLVIASNVKKALENILDYLEDVDPNDIEVTVRDLSEGEIMHYDCEDLYFEGFKKI